MDSYSPFDYLSNEPFYIDGIGSIRSPTLRDIRKISYHVFSIYMNLISCTLQDYLTLYHPDGRYANISRVKESTDSFYLLLLHSNIQVLFLLISFFITDQVEFDDKTMSFVIFKGTGDTRETLGTINQENFEQFRNELQNILGLKKPDETEPKFKNETAKKMYEKMQKNTRLQRKKQDENYTLENMLKKYCTHNKVGINILNVWDMTYYQFITMFNEYCSGRQCDINDMMAANTFSYKSSADYQPLEYMQNLNNH